MKEFQDIIDRLNTWIKGLTSPLPDIVLMGDFNFPNHNWAQHQLISSSIQITILLNATDSLFLEQAINVPTRNHNILDLIFTSSDFIDSVSVQKTAISDHNIIYVQTNLQVETDDLLPVTSIGSAKNLPRNSFETLNFNRADYAKLNSELETVDWSRILNSSSATECFASFMDVLSSTCSEYVPRKTTSSSSIHKNSFYKPRRPLMRRRTKINTMLSTVNYSKSQKLIRELIDIEHKLMSSHNEERLHYENVAISRIRSDSKYFFRYADKYRKGKKCVGPLDCASLSK